MIVAVPSKGRAGLVKTQKVIPSCRVYVPELEVDAYRRAGTQNVVGVPNRVHGITKTRNWILDHADDLRVVMIDDDVRACGWRKMHAEASQTIKLSGDAWLGEFRKVFEITEQLHYRIWGVGTDGATRAYYPYWPFRWRAFVTASCMGIVNDGRTRFDESYPVKEDYELCCRCLTEDGGVVMAQYLFWVNSHWNDDGGCKDYRTQPIEHDCMRRLRRAYPGLI